MSKVVPKVKLGILSGVGPLAGAYVYERVVIEAAARYGAKDDDEYPDVFLVSHGISDVGNEAELTEAFRDEIIKGVRQLQTMGAECIGIACNTAHVFWDEIVSNTNVRVVNLLEELALESARQKHKYLLLSSRSSRERSLHIPALEKHKVNFSTKSDVQQAKLDKVIGLVMAYKLREAADILDGVLNEAYEEGYTGIIAACTEIPLAMRLCKNTHGLYVVDGNYVLAKALTKNCYSLTAY